MEESWELKPKIEALLVASDRPVSIAALAACLGVTEDEADEALREFQHELATIRSLGLQLLEKKLRTP